MPGDRNPSHYQKSESVAFRVPASLKADLSRLATRNHQSLGELLRACARQRLALERHRDFKEEAHRQSREAAEAARDSVTDEHAVMRELEAELDEIENGWN